MGNLKEQLKALAEKLGVNAVGFASADLWETGGQKNDDFTPRDVWPTANGVVVLGIPFYSVEQLPFADEFGNWDVRYGILDTAAYRLSLYLNSLGYPSVNIPTDSGGALNMAQHSPRIKHVYPTRQTVPVFSHRQAGVLTRLIDAKEQDNLLLASVLTSFKF
jgi:hypothetical protein